MRGMRRARGWSPRRRGRGRSRPRAGRSPPRAGIPDGEAISREEMIDGVRIVARAVELPVTADLERGFGDARMTLESRDRGGRGRLQPRGLRRQPASCGRPRSTPRWSPPRGRRATRRASRSSSTPAPTSSSSKSIPAEERVVAALERGAAYLEAGADCIFVPFVRDLATIETLVKEMGGPDQRDRRRGRADAGRAGAASAWPASATARGRWASRWPRCRARPRRCSRAATRPRTWRSAL